MFKRLFFISGIIAFMLACLTMYFWYLPKQEIKTEQEATINHLTVDSVIVADTILNH